jgi:hypothetical protein
VTDRAETLRLIRGMVMAVASEVAGGEAVRTQVEVNDEFDPPELLKLRVFIGQRSTVVAISGSDVDRIRGDEATRRKVERQVGSALSGINRGDTEAPDPP